VPFYHNIDNASPEGKRTIQNLLRLRQALDVSIPPKNLDHSIILATWNLREFDSLSFGRRMDESFYHIAEIISRFDLVAIQEIRKDLTALKKLQEILGSNWKYIVSDVTEGSKGNKERMGFLYDGRKIKFSGLAGELVLPPLEYTENGKRKYRPISQLARTPFMCGFKAGWTKFILATVHVLYGTDSAKDPLRIEEIEQIAGQLKKRTQDKTAWSKNLILLGDFNIFKKDDETYKAITKSGFSVPKELQELPGSNIQQNRHYDQIAFRARKGRLVCTGKAGIFDFFDHVFRKKDEADYVVNMGEKYIKTSKGKIRDEKSKSRYYKTYWRTHQMSDHLPMWLELRINHGDEYLKQMLAAK